MSNNPQDQKFKKWLDILQQESWQLELIISGFAIYGLFMIIDPIESALLQAQNNSNMYRLFLIQGLMTSWYILTINLIAHVILRGLWIGAIGLRYVSGDIEYDELKYSPKFTKHLMKRVGSFDNYVATLEKYCSVIFAVTFLLVFYLLGLLVIIAVLTFLGLWVDQGEASKSLRYWIAIPMIIFISIGAVLTFIDFATQGWLKKKKWTTVFYYPVYWVFKYLTLSFLYRPMVYNFLDTKFGRRLILVIVPLYIGLGIMADTGFSTSNYLEEDLNSNAYISNMNNYEDLIAINRSYADRASIPTKVITNSFLNVFVVYGKGVEDDVFFFNEDLKPNEDRRGIYSGFSSGTLDWSERKKSLIQYLETIEEMYTMKIDTLPIKPKFVISENTQKQLGFETVLDLREVPRGKRVLEIVRKDHRRDSTYHRTIIKIPFWYYHDN